MGTRVTASLIISIYNQPRELEFILLRLIQQSVQDFEVIVADDGSTAEVGALIAEYRRDCPFPITHCRHEHRQYRLPTILNKATLLAKAQYLIYLNGDCIPHRRYVEGHLLLRRPDRVLNGRRGVLLQPSLTKALTPAFVARPDFDRVIRFFWWYFRGDVRAVERRLWIAAPLLRRLFIRDHDNLVGADLSLFKEAMLQANGFDETMAGLGGSDRELGHRLKLLGLKIVSTRHLTITYHLEHPSPPWRIHATGELRELLSQNRIPFCRYGLRNLSSGSETGTLLRERLSAAAGGTSRSGVESRAEARK